MITTLALKLCCLETLVAPCRDDLSTARIIFHVNTSFSKEYLTQKEENERKKDLDWLNHRSEVLWRTFRQERVVARRQAL